jgi:hypothetical protein
MGRPGNRCLDKEKVREVTKALDKLEEQLLNRLPRAADLSQRLFQRRLKPSTKFWS